MEVNKARREFLKITGSALSTAAVSTLGTHAVGIQGWEKPSNISSAHEKLNILFLGGTGFIGPHQVEYALARGHNVTLFNRGKTNPELFPDVEKLRGDRNNDLKALENRRWDAVIDNSAHIPRWITDVSQILQDKVRQYLFISSTVSLIPT